MITNSLSNIVPASEARSNFYYLLNEVNKKLRQFIITLRGKEQAVLLSVEEWQSWQETLEIMSDKKLVQSIKKGLRSKKTYSQKEVDKIIGW